MLLATILLLCPFPQIEGTTKAVTKRHRRGSQRFGQRFFPLSAVALGTGT